MNWTIPDVSRQGIAIIESPSNLNVSESMTNRILGWRRCGVLAVVLLSSLGGFAKAQPNRAVRLLAPAYFYPAGEGLKSWEKLITSAAKAPVVAIVNPDSGPGKRRDPRYAELFVRAKNTPITLIGYVTLSYAERPLSAVKADIDSWLHFYPDVQGIFFDEQPSQAEHANFAQEAFVYARHQIKQGVFVTNPGVPCAQEYLAGHDAPAACIFEHHAGFEQFQPPDLLAAKRSQRLAVLVCQVKSADEMRKTLQLAMQKGAGYVYITDAASPVPWDRLPGYWSEEIEAVAQENRGRESK